MKAIIIIVFALFSLSKSEDAFLQEFLQNANKIPQTTSYSKYVKNVASTINAISDIVESSKLSILPSLGVPKSVVDNFSDAEFSIGRVSTPREEYSINLKSGALTMGLGIASMKKEHIRFSYVEVKVTAETIAQKINKPYRTCKKFLFFKKCKNHDNWVERGFNSAEFDSIVGALKARARYEIINRISVMYRLSADDSTYLSKYKLFLE